MGKKLDLTGQVFGRLTALAEHPERIGKKKDVAWLCACQCGAQTVVTAYQLRSGKTKSCGCYHKERASEANLVHGQCRIGRMTAEFSVWQGMHKRCSNPNEDNFKYYGGRGVTVCSRWSEFENFFADMGPRPGPEFSIDRIDHNGNYEPSNCKWSTHEEQMNNTTRNRYIQLGCETRSLADWCKVFGRPYKTVSCRLSMGWPVERALSEPVLSSKHDVADGEITDGQ